MIIQTTPNIAPIVNEPISPIKTSAGYALTKEMQAQSLQKQTILQLILHFPM